MIFTAHILKINKQLYTNSETIFAIQFDFYYNHLNFIFNFI